MPAHPVICEHKRLWTTCSTCGKEVIEAVRNSPPPSDDDFVAPRFRRPPTEVEEIPVTGGEEEF